MTTPSRNSHSPFPPFKVSLLLVLGALAAAGIIGSPVLASEELQAVISKLQSRYEALEDLESDFTQITRFEGFSTTVNSKGRFYLKKGKLRWDYLEPTRQQIFVDGDQMLFYVPEHQQVIKSQMGAELDSQVPIRLLAGGSHLDRDFQIRWADEARPKDPGGAYRLILIPKSPGPGFHEIQMAVDPTEYLINQVILKEQGGNSSEFEFSKIRINHGIKDRLFKFDIPKGVVVVEQP